VGSNEECWRGREVMERAVRMKIVGLDGVRLEG
jgi:hypothetical protein